MANIITLTKKELEEIIKTLPIAYYLGRKIKIVVVEGKGSYYDTLNDVIYIDLTLINHSLATKWANTNNELVRPMQYHEIAHVILSIRGWYWNEHRNIFEDERIEFIFRNFFMNTDFKAQCLAINGYDPMSPDVDAKTPIELFFRIVRFRQCQNKKLLQEVQYIIDVYSHLMSNSDLHYWNGYFYDVDEFFKKVKRYFKTLHKNQPQTQSQQNQNQQQNNSKSSSESSNQDQDANSESQNNNQSSGDATESNEQENDGEQNEGEEANNNEDGGEDNNKQSSGETSEENQDDQDANAQKEKEEKAKKKLEKQLKKLAQEREELFKNMKNENPVKVEDLRGKVKEMFSEENRFDKKYYQKVKEFLAKVGDGMKFRGGAVARSSGRLDINALKKNWGKNLNWFKAPAEGSLNGKGKKVINLFIDSSGSYMNNVGETNEIIGVLKQVAEKDKSFEYNVVGIGQYNIYEANYKTYGAVLINKDEPFFLGNGSSNLEEGGDTITKDTWVGYGMESKERTMSSFKGLFNYINNKYSNGSTKVINIILFDGDVFLNTANDWQNYYKFMDRKDTYIISDYENKACLDEIVKVFAKHIDYVAGRYAYQLKQKVYEAITKLAQ